MAKVGIVGGSGYTGAELLRIIAAHPQLDLVVATGDTQAGSAVAELYPSLAAAFPDVQFVELDPDGLDGLDIVFCGLPHGASQSVVPQLIDRVGHLVDLGADFRLADPSVYATWYHETHTVPQLIDRFAYGLPELYRDQIVYKGNVAVPGCYPSTAILTLAPLVDAGLVQRDRLIVDAASGVSGAGRPPKAHTTFCSVDEDFTAYGLLDHRHTPEIEQALGGTVLFTPHLAPMNRGILATCYAEPTREVTTADLLTAMEEFYADEAMVVVSERSPSTKATLGANVVHMTARFDDRTGRVMAIGALDNLTKGASGAAVQCANLLLGLDEATGLATAGLYP